MVLLNKRERNGPFWPLHKGYNASIKKEILLITSCTNIINLFFPLVFWLTSKQKDGNFRVQTLSLSCLRKPRECKEKQISIIIPL